MLWSQVDIKNILEVSGAGGTRYQKDLEEDKECDDKDRFDALTNKLVVIVLNVSVMCGYPDIVQGNGVVYSRKCLQLALFSVFRKESQSDYNSYKLFGVDFFLDEALKPWLLELNNFPSMEKASLDRYVNDPMISEMFNIAGFHYSGKPNAKQKKVKSKK